MNQKTLSVILPIYNGSHIISYTLSLLKEQILRNQNDVDFYICDNASTDGTLDILNQLNGNSPYYRIIHYDIHVGIGESISRSIENATGKYVLLWSDDDIPSPTMIDTILMFLKEYPEVSILHFNRLTGYTEGSQFGIGRLKVYKNKVDSLARLYDDSEQFAVEHYQGMDFLSCDVIRKDAWDKGMTVYDNRHCGYEFIVPMLYGAKGQQCLFIEFPLCVHRGSHRPRWIAKLPLYWFVGAPRMIFDMEKLGIIHNGQEVWKQSYYNNRSFKSFVGLMTICLKDRDLYLSVIDELCSYQSSKWRRLAAKIIVRYFPASLREWKDKRRYGQNYVKDSNGSYPLIP